MNLPYVINQIYKLLQANVWKWFECELGSLHSHHMQGLLYEITTIKQNKTKLLFNTLKHPQQGNCTWHAWV
jgi:hypothetical protein